MARNHARMVRTYGNVLNYRAMRGYSPTIRELADLEQCAVSTMKWHVDKLVELGMLTRDPRVARSIIPSHPNSKEPS